MTPEVFGKQLVKAFGLKLTPEEVEEVTHVLDRNQNGLIESNEFLLGFFELGGWVGGWIYYRGYLSSDPHVLC